MPTLRFDTDEGRTVATALRQAVETMQAEVNRAGSSVEGLVPADWAAPAAKQFAGLSRDWQQTMTQTLERLTDLTRRLEAEIVQWEEAAARFGEGAAAGGSVAGAGAVLPGQMFFEPAARRPEMPGFEPVAEEPVPVISAPSGSAPSPGRKTFGDLIAEDSQSGKTGSTPQAVAKTDKFLADRKISDTVIQSYSAVRGETVTGDDGLDKYYRHSYNGVYRSNCTWYAAAAVTAASGGAINLQNYGAETGIRNLGNGGNWASAARQWVQDYGQAGTPEAERVVSGVDKMPQAGDVFCNNQYHVAFVEEVRTSADGQKVYVVVSEENAGAADGSYVGQPVDSKNSADISPQAAPDEEGRKAIKRYRRVMTFDNVNAGTDTPPAIQGDADFIHINYNYQPAVSGV